MSSGSAGPGLKNLLSPSNCYGSEVKAGLNAAGNVSGNKYLCLTYVVLDYNNNGENWNINNAALISQGVISQEEFRHTTKSAHIGAFATREGQFITVYLAFDPETGDIYVQSLNTGANQARYVNDLKHSNYYKVSTTYLNYMTGISLGLLNLQQLFLYISIAIGIALSIYIVWSGWGFVRKFLT